ncbi:MAG: hypothetical protein WC949_03945, partial [Candidatus Paceibacterota bacterium]
MPFPKPSPRALAVISSAIVLSLSAGYIALAWTEPVGTMPVTVAAPLNTGGFAQTKTGDLALTGTLTASSFIDFDNNSYHVNPSGQTVLAGPVGIGTTVPYASLNIGGNGTNISNKGLIVGTVGDSIFTNIPLNGETGRFEIGFPGWRDTEPLQIGAKIAAIRKNVYQDNNALIQSTDLVFFTGSGTTGVNNPAFHDTSTEKFRITSDGKVVINNGGQLCIGTACANSTTWNSMISGAGSGGGGGTIGMAVEEPTCAWNSIDSGGALGSCIPASCQSGFTDAGISCEANGITGAYMTGQFHQSTVGSCQRICYMIGPGAETSMKPTCAWNSIDSGGALGSCTPNSCPSGFTDDGVGCEANGITGAYMTGQFHQSTVGSCQRICSSNITGGSASGGFAHLQVLTATGTFTIPAGVAKVYVELYGAGGGGGSGNYGASGSGGGAGGVVTGFLTVSPGQNISVTTGSGGSAWAAGGQSSLTYASNTIYAYGGGAGGYYQGGAGGSGSAGGLSGFVVQNGGGGSGGVGSYSASAAGGSGGSNTAAAED